MEEKWLGPYTIHADMENGCYLLRMPPAKY